MYFYLFSSVAADLKRMAVAMNPIYFLVFRVLYMYNSLILILMHENS